MRRHGPVIAHCTDSEDFQNFECRMYSVICGEEMQNGIGITLRLQLRSGLDSDSCPDFQKILGKILSLA